MLDIFRITDAQSMTADLLSDYITRNDVAAATRYSRLHAAYEGDYPVYHQPAKPAWKPDNRLGVNFARYIVETFEGFFMGIPVKVTAEDKELSEYVNYLDSYNLQDDQNAELSRIVSIYGRGYEIYYIDENGEICTAVLDPMESFMIYSDSIKPRPRYFVRTYTGADGVRRGSISDETTVRYFEYNPELQFLPEEKSHGFSGVPATEYTMNRSRRGIFEDVLPLIDSYNRALSEKADDVDYFSDAYLKVLGTKIDKDTANFMRSNRIINLDGDCSGIVVDFLQKPSGDDTQEHLLDRLERQIFSIAMVCNISDEQFATSSGIALRYKLLPMINLASTKEMKFRGCLMQRYRTIFSNPLSQALPDSWTGLQFTFTRNLPADLLDEAETAGKLAGITSRKTQLSVLSMVDDVDREIAQIEAEDTEVTDEPLRITE